jgi:translation initiation factor IF-3
MGYNTRNQKKYFHNDDKNRGNEHRINWQIKVPQVRVVMDEQQLGVMPTEQARKLAQEYGLDLVEVSADAKPPVCRIMDYNKFKYEQKIKQKTQAKKQRESEINLKELRLRPSIGEHDVDTKINHAINFLQGGDKVQFTLQFRGQREMSHKEQGFVVMEKIMKALAEYGDIEKIPKMEGNRIVCCFNPKS